jgi:hypothetical protein
MASSCRSDAHAILRLDVATDVSASILAAEDTTHVTHVVDWSSGDFVMDLDKPVSTDGILRVGLAMNYLIVAQAKKDHHR